MLQKYRIQNKTVTGSYSSVAKIQDTKQNSYWLLQQCCKNTGYETKQLLAPTAVLQKYRIRNKTVTGSYSSVAKIQDTKQNSYWLLQQCCKNTGYETKQLLAPTAVLQKYRIQNKTVTGSYSSVAKIQDTKQNSYWLLQQCCKNTGYETKQLLAPTAVLQKYRIQNKTVTGSSLDPQTYFWRIFRMTLPGT